MVEMATAGEAVAGGGDDGFEIFDFLQGDVLRGAGL